MYTTRPQIKEIMAGTTQTVLQALSDGFSSPSNISLKTGNRKDPTIKDVTPAPRFPQPATGERD